MKTPTAFRHLAQGWRVREATLGNGAIEFTTVKGLRQRRTNRHNPVGVEKHFDSFTQGSRCAPTLGWMTLPRWGKQLAAAQTEKERTYFENKCASLDRQIDALVYDLYGLTEPEIKIVEGAT
jgi:hypothetical protein